MTNYKSFSAILFIWRCSHYPPIINCHIIQQLENHYYIMTHNLAWYKNFEKPSGQFLSLIVMSHWLSDVWIQIQDISFVLPLSCSFGKSCLLVSWCACGKCGMVDNNEDCDRSMRLAAEGRGWSHRSGTWWSDDQEIGWRRVWSAACIWRWGARVSSLSLKTKVDGLSVVWLQNHRDDLSVVWPQIHLDGFRRFSLKIGSDSFSRFIFKTGGGGFFGLSSKLVAMVSLSLTSKPVATISLGLASNSVVEGFLICASKSAATVW
jgi:hypothetical protein